MAKSTASGRQVNLFDLSPIRIGGFILKGRTVEPAPVSDLELEEGTPSKPTIQGWQEAMTYASASEESAPYWVGELLAYAEDRDDWREKLSQAMTVTNLAQQTLENRATLVRKVAEPERQLAPTPSHASEVASLPKAEQRTWLQRAREEGWTRNELRQEIRASKRAMVLEGQATLAGMYRVLYASPDWSEPEALLKLPVAAHMQPRSVGFFWVPPSQLYANPGPRDVIEGWGFDHPRPGLIWDGVLGLGGAIVDVRHMHVIIATRGECLPDAPLPLPDSVLTERREGHHGDKPVAVRRLIERLYTRGPWLALGLPAPAPWTCLGFDAKVWAHDAQKSA